LLFNGIKDKYMEVYYEGGTFRIPIPPKTIPEGEEPEEFKGIKNLEELVTDMHKVTKLSLFDLFEKLE